MFGAEVQRRGVERDGNVRLKRRDARPAQVKRAVGGESLIEWVREGQDGLIKRQTVTAEIGNLDIAYALPMGLYTLCELNR